MFYAFLQKDQNQWQIHWHFTPRTSNNKKILFIISLIGLQIKSPHLNNAMKQSKTLNSPHIYSLNREWMQSGKYSATNTIIVHFESILYLLLWLYCYSFFDPCSHYLRRPMGSMWNYGRHGSRTNNNNHWIFAPKAKPFELLFQIRICNAKMLHIFPAEMKISHCVMINADCKLYVNDFRISNAYKT